MVLRAAVGASFHGYDQPARCVLCDLARLRLEKITLRPGTWHSAANVFNPQSCLDDADVAVEPFPPYESRQAAPVR
jgi:hypothetical protein